MGLSAYTVALLILLTGCVGHPAPDLAAEAITPSSDRPAAPLVEITDGWLAMGTFFEVDLRVPPSREMAARAWLSRVRPELVRFEKIYSRHDADSELSRFNRSLASTPVWEAEAGPELARLIEAAFEFHRATAGRFDPSVGPLIGLWWQSAASGREPSPEAIASAMRSTGLSRLERVGRARYRAPGKGFSIDLDGLSKGAVLDAVADDFSASFPAASALFSLGQSSVRAIGRPNPEAEGWRLALRSRGDTPRIWSEIMLRDQALSVSSSRGSVMRIGDRNYSHLIDPTRGRPIRLGREVAVVGPSALVADAWSTALLLIADTTDAEEAMRMATEQNLEAKLVDFESADFDVPRTVGGAGNRVGDDGVVKTLGWSALETRSRTDVKGTGR